MFNLSSNSKLRGIGYKVLNVLRPCNVIALLAVTAASWVMIVMTGVTGQFFFFDAIAHVFVSSIAMFLIMTEVQFGPLKKYFIRSWPVFSDSNGFFWLGAAMVVLGCDMLGNLNKPAFSIKNLGLPLWRLILASGILSVTFGIFNFIATVVFRDGPAGLTARMIRTDGNLADGGKLGLGVSSHSMNDYAMSRSGSSRRYKPGSSRSNSNNLHNKEDGMYSERSVSPVDQNDTTGHRNFGGVAANQFKRMTRAFKSPFSNGVSKMQISSPMPIPADHNSNNTAASGGDEYMHTVDLDVERAAGDAAAGHPGDRDSVYRNDYTSPTAKLAPPPNAKHPAYRSSNYSAAYMPDRF